MHQKTNLPAPAKLSEDRLKAMKKPELVQTALALANRLKAREGEIAALGQSVLFVRRDPTGKELQAYRAEVKLAEARKELATIQNTPMITANGAAKLNQIANLQVLTPPSVIVDGVEQHNPYIERADRTRAIKSVWIRRVAFGPSPTGNMVAVDSTLYFNVYTYFLQDLQAKIKRYPACGVLGVEDQKPEEISYQPRKWQPNPSGRGGKYVNDGEVKTVKLVKKPLAFYPIEPPVGLWVDLSHPEIQAAFNEHVSRQKFGDRHARSICTRNVLLEHPAIATKTLVGGKEAGVVVYGWRHNMTMKNISETASKIVEGEVEDKDVQVVQTGIKEATPEDVAATAGAEVDEFGEVVDVEAPAEAPAQGPAEEEPDIWDEMGRGDSGEASRETPEEAQGKDEPEASGERRELITQVLEGMEIAGKDKVEELLKREFEGKKLEKLTKAQLTLLLRKVNSLIDQALA